MPKSDGYFKPGNKAGKGRPLIPEDLKNVKSISADQAKKIITMFIAMSEAELNATLKDEKAPALHKIIAQIILKSISGGDQTRMEFLFNRTIGRVLEKMELSMPKPFMIKRPDGSVLLGAKDDDDERS